MTKKPVVNLIDIDKQSKFKPRSNRMKWALEAFGEKAMEDLAEAWIRGDVTITGATKALGKPINFTNGTSYLLASILRAKYQRTGKLF
jgi:hypothetical protein